ncbi:MAG: hypothetical protein MZW92_50935 [Comamonadaceae bacterium]|nr:hypothetical protein [Comamonadaceae bacterium]
MLRKLLSVFAVLSFVAVTPSVTHSQPIEPLYKPDPIQVPAGYTIASVKRAVRKGMYLKEWQIREARPNFLEGMFLKGDKYSITLEIEYSDKAVTIRYKDSAGLDYSGGAIHRTYNERVLSLEKAIRAELDAF